MQRLKLMFFRRRNVSKGADSSQGRRTCENGRDQEGESHAIVAEGCQETAKTSEDSKGRIACDINTKR